MKKSPATYQLSEDTKKRLRKAAPELELSQQDIVDKAINAYLDSVKEATGKNV